MCAVAALQFGNVCVLESVCCNGAVQEMAKYGCKGALVPAYPTTSTNAWDMMSWLGHDISYG